jgi:hypothetical protein
MPSDEHAVDPRSAIGEPGVELPEGYVYGVTRYADVILERAFPEQLDQIRTALERFHPHVDELRAGGGSRTPFVARFDASLEEQGWGKRNISIEKRIDGEPISRVRSHEIDMFAARSDEGPYPGIAVEMEWSNKDPFFDRDLLNFQALHREGALAVGVIVTRGPTLQDIIGPVIRSAEGGAKYSAATTHWDKLVPRVNLGGGGECPLLLIGIEPERIEGIEVVCEVRDKLRAADAKLANWQSHYASHRDAVAACREAKGAALASLPPL